MKAKEMSARHMRYYEALREAQAQLLRQDPNTLLMGLGVPGPTGVFGTTSGLQEEFGPNRVFDMPASENAMTGIALGAASVGKRPIVVHMRVDFAVLAMEPLVNQAAKWHYMYGGRLRAPITVRMVIGRGWGQGPQHSQSLQAWFAHVPGLKVAMPSTAYDAKGMLIAAVRDDAPVVLLEHRWLYNIAGIVPAKMYEVALGKAAVIRPGRDLTIASTSYMTIESLRAAEMLAQIGINAEIVDIRSIAPLDLDTIAQSVARTGRLVVADTGQSSFGVGAEVIAATTERHFKSLTAPPRRVGLPHVPTPTSPALADHFYPGARDIAEAALATFDSPRALPPEETHRHGWRDVPGNQFEGPY